jgi:hypothetical protein
VLSRSRHGDGQASRQARTGLDPVAIIDRIKHAPQTRRVRGKLWQGTSATNH